MRFVLNAAEKDLRRYLRDPLALVLWLGIPLLVGTLISLVTGGSESSPPSAHLLVADEDGAVLSGLLARAFGKDKQGQLLRVEAVKNDEGLARIGRGEATALLVIPDGFGDAVLNERPTKLLLVTNPAQSILPEILQEVLEILADGAFYLHRVIGPELKEIVKGPPKGDLTLSDDAVARISVSFNEIVKRLQKYLAPPVIDVELSADQAANGGQVSPTKLFLPGVLFMALVFMAEGLSADVWRERDLGTLRRAACTPAAVVTLLGGKLLAGSIVILGSTLAALVAGILYLNMPLLNLPLALVWGTLSGVVLLLLFTAIQLHASSQRAGSVLANSLVMPLLFVGGSFFPFEMMPDWMAALGRWTPNGWALQHLKDILFGRETFPALVAASISLLLIAVVLFLITERRMRRVFIRS